MDEVIYLLAELLDNATRFSPPSSQVQVEAKQVGDLLHIQIRDEGMGMGEAELRATQDRLADPRRLDLRATQHMDMPAIASIVDRHGITIEFRSAPRQGTWVDLTIPGDLVERRHQALHEPTAELTPVSAARRPDPPPSWPALPAPAPVAQAVPVIYEQLRRDPSWFQPTTTGPFSAVPAFGWQAAARAAEAAHSAVAAEWTESGLPVREPGQRVIPSVVSPAGPPARVLREPEQQRRQMSAYQTGLGLAGRRQVPHE